MTSIEKRLKNLELLDEAIANEDGEWGNTPEEWEVYLEILVAGGAVEEDIPFVDDDYYLCPYIKIDGSICNKGCIRIEGCGDHWNSKNKGPGTPCKTKSCKKSTRIESGFCRKHTGSRYKKYKKM